MAKAAVLRKRSEPAGDELAAVFDVLDPIRLQIAGLQEQLDNVELAPITEEEALQRVKVWINSMADQSTLNANAFVTRERPQPEMIGSEVSGSGISVVRFGPVVHLLCAVFPDQVFEAYAKAIRAEYAEGDGISDAERDQTTKLLKEKLLGLEIQEEQVIVQAHAKGLYIRRRERLNPLALCAP